MTDSVIIDTDILIDAGRGVTDAVKCLSEIKRRSLSAVSIITYMELIVGCRNKQELIQLDRFMSRFQVIKLNDRISDIGSDLLHKYRLSHGLLIPDALIAATAIFVGSFLVSKNYRDYRFIEKLNMLPYPNPFT
jgi:predicted nucleic acid-binding protein